MNTQLVFWQ